MFCAEVRNEHEQSVTNGKDPTVLYKSRMIFSFTLFFIFFIFYIGVAILNTPVFKETAAIPCMGMPLGMFLSLSIFPASWFLIVIYFYFGR